MHVKEGTEHEQRKDESKMKDLSRDASNEVMVDRSHLMRKKKMREKNMQGIASERARGHGENIPKTNPTTTPPADRSTHFHTSKAMDRDEQPLSKTTSPPTCSRPAPPPSPPFTEMHPFKCPQNEPHHDTSRRPIHTLPHLKSDGGRDEQPLS
jgi:hypothetical protein